MKKIGLLLALVCAISTAHAELKLPAIIGEHMVLQQKQANPIWGWDTPGTAVSVTFAGKTYPATAGADGKWNVKLDAAPANAAPQTLVIAGTTKQAPVWMQRSGLEWSYRLAQEPKRLARRYLWGNPRFVYSVVRQRFGGASQARE
jgi:hypothetical protein